jgi:hypothetical protein
MRPENIGMGLAQSQPRGGQKLTERDNIAYLEHSRVTKQPTRARSPSESTLSTPSVLVVADLTGADTWQRKVELVTEVARQVW